LNYYLFANQGKGISLTRVNKSIHDCNREREREKRKGKERERERVLIWNEFNFESNYQTINQTNKRMND